ncbi:hypothetical protein SISNIDRAFT_452974 [Sistotremastrum niveocremeum HHB9708]|uniref:MYND-type domain-containing protein n=1 Tax=Sistotremastrum niveocremeum HHB9708 TaxID=1314777 RepID=A0A164W8S0_9AGAM|nr:hypothetical protein SISNIDRAFT_452974 [Sistotremastrum niveocremeum HHB9708]
MALSARREDMLHVLESLGMELPSSTKMSEERLKSKISKALDYAQLFSKRLPSSTLEVASLDTWKGQLGRAFHPGNAMEGMRMFQVFQSTGEAPSQEKNILLNLRETLSAMGQIQDAGEAVLMIKDADEQSVILVRILDVFELNAKTPVMILLYDRTLPGESKSSNFEFVAASPAERMAVVVMSIPSQRLLLRLLSLNSHRIASSYKPIRQPYEKDYQLSFVMPTGPLSMRDLGTLNEEKGCELCGKHATKKCTGCESVTYCSKACQAEAWPLHKQTCKDLSQGTWTTMRFLTGAEALPLAGERNINRFSRFDDVDEETTLPIGPPQNVHGGKRFVVKIQVNMGSSRVYDRRLSLDFFLSAQRDPVNYMKLCIAAGTGFKGLKCYRWAKRVSDWELSICLDRPLPQDPKW